MSVDLNSGKISVSKSKPAGTYTMKIIGTLPDLTTTAQIFTIIIRINFEPSFKTSLSDLPVPLNKKTIFTFPDIIDPDFGDITSISIVKD